MKINITKSEQKLRALEGQIKRINQKMQSGNLSSGIFRLRYFQMQKQKERLMRHVMQRRDLIQFRNNPDYLKNYLKTRQQQVWKTVFRIALYTILITYAVITLYPFFWSIFASFRSQNDFANATLNPFPESWNTDAYNYLFNNQNSNFSQWIVNSFLICIGGVALNILLNTVAGYALARIRFRGRGLVLWIFLAFTMIPGQVLLIPNYLLIKDFNLLNNLLGLIIPSAINIGYIFMSRQFFINLARDVEEAALIDGMSRFKLIMRVVFPMMRPLILTQTIFLFMSFWNSFIQAQLYINESSKFPLTLGIQRLVETDAYKIQYPQILAASTFSMLPVLALYIGLNRLLLKGQRGDTDK